VSLNHQHITTVPAVSVADTRSQQVGMKDLEDGTPVYKPLESDRLMSTSSVSPDDPVLNLMTCIYPSVDTTDQPVDTVSSVSDTRTSVTVDDSVGSVTEFTEQIARAKDGLMSASRHTVSLQVSPRVTETNSTTDDIWTEISRRVSQSRQLKIRDLDFSDLISTDDTDLHSAARLSLSSTTIPTPPAVPVFTVPPPPPPPLGDCIAAAAPSLPTSSTVKTRKTMKLHWKEAKQDVRSVVTETIWTEMVREMSPVTIDGSKLEHLFETRTIDMKAKVSDVCTQV